MNWNNIEKEVALQTETLVHKRSDIHALNSAHTSFDNSFSSARYGNRTSNSNTIIADNHGNNDIIKVLFNEISELRSSFKSQNSNLFRYELQSEQLQKNYDSIYERLDIIEYNKKLSFNNDFRKYPEDIQFTLKHIENRIEEIEHNAKNNSIHYATKETLSKLLDSTFERLNSLNSSFDESRNEITKTSDVSQALINALVSLNGEYNGRYQIELVNSFSKDLSKDQLSRIVTESVKNAIESSIQTHLKTAIGFLNSSVHSVIEELRNKQDIFAKDVVQEISNLTKQFASLSSGIISSSTNAATANKTVQYEINEAISKIIDQKTALIFENDLESIRNLISELHSDTNNTKDALITQVTLVNNLISTEQLEKSVRNDENITLKTEIDQMKNKFSELNYSNATLKSDLLAALENFSQSKYNDILISVENKQNINFNEIDIKNKELHTYLNESIQHIQVELEEKLSSINIKIEETKTTVLGMVDSVEKSLSEQINNLDVKINLNEKLLSDLESKQIQTISCYDQLSSSVSVVQSGCDNFYVAMSKMESKLTKQENQLLDNESELKSLKQDISVTSVEVLSSNNRHQQEYMEAIAKLQQRGECQDVSLVTLETKLHSLENEIFQKDKETLDSITKVSKRIDELDQESQSKYMAITKDTQVKVQGCSEEIGQLVRKINMEDALFMTQLDSFGNSIKANKIENEESLAKLNRKIDLFDAELQSKFQSRYDKLDNQFIQLSENLTKLICKIDTFESNSQSKLSELTNDYKSKCSDNYEATSQLSKRIDKNYTEIFSNIHEIDTAVKLANEKYSKFNKTQESTIECLQATLHGVKNELSVRIVSTGESLSSLAQQHYDLLQLQETQESNLTSLNTRLDERCELILSTLKIGLSDQSKSTQNALQELNYDILQITGRISTTESLQMKMHEELNNIDKEYNKGIPPLESIKQHEDYVSQNITNDKQLDKMKEDIIHLQSTNNLVNESISNYKLTLDKLSMKVHELYDLNNMEVFKSLKSDVEMFSLEFQELKNEILKVQDDYNKLVSNNQTSMQDLQLLVNAKFEEVALSLSVMEKDKNEKVEKIKSINENNLAIISPNVNSLVLTASIEEVKLRLECFQTISDFNHKELSRNVNQIDENYRKLDTNLTDNQLKFTELSFKQSSLSTLCETTKLSLAALQKRSEKDFSATNENLFNLNEKVEHLDSTLKSFQIVTDSIKADAAAIIDQDKYVSRESMQRYDNRLEFLQQQIDLLQEELVDALQTMQLPQTNDDIVNEDNQSDQGSDIFPNSSNQSLISSKSEITSVILENDEIFKCNPNLPQHMSLLPSDQMNWTVNPIAEGISPWKSESFLSDDDDDVDFHMTQEEEEVIEDSRDRKSDILTIQDLIQRFKLDKVVVLIGNKNTEREVEVSRSVREEEVDEEVKDINIQSTTSPQSYAKNTILNSESSVVFGKEKLQLDIVRNPLDDVLHNGKDIHDPALHDMKHAVENIHGAQEISEEDFLSLILEPLKIIE